MKPETILRLSLAFNPPATGTLRTIPLLPFLGVNPTSPHPSVQRAKTKGADSLKNEVLLAQALFMGGRVNRSFYMLN